MQQMNGYPNQSVRNLGTLSSKIPRNTIELRDLMKLYFSELNLWTKDKVIYTLLS